MYHPKYYYWSLSPYTYNEAAEFGVGTDGCLVGTFVYNIGGAVAPVINLSAEYVKTLKGTGTMTDPYQPV